MAKQQQKAKENADLIYATTPHNFPEGHRYEKLSIRQVAQECKMSIGKAREYALQERKKARAV